jgi:hypothetical protein
VPTQRHVDKAVEQQSGSTISLSHGDGTVSADPGPRDIPGTVDEKLAGSHAKPTLPTRNFAWEAPKSLVN